MQKGFILLLLIFLFAACTMPETKIYSLSLPYEKESPKEKHTVNASLAILIESPKHLSRPYIVFRNSPYQIAISKYSKWDAPPTEIVRGAFRDALVTSGLFREIKLLTIAPKDFYTLKINLRRFERIDEGEKFSGEIIFDVSFISPEGRESYLGTVSKKILLETQKSDSLAKGLSKALADGIEEIKANIIKALKQ